MEPTYVAMVSLNSAQTYGLQSRSFYVWAARCHTCCFSMTDDVPQVAAQFLDILCFDPRFFYLDETCCELFVIWVKMNDFSFPLNAQPEHIKLRNGLRGTKAGLQLQIPQAFLLNHHAASRAR